MRFLLTINLLVIMLFSACSLSSQVSEAPSTFTNPIIDDGADPWVIAHEGTYYHCYSRDNSIFVSSTTALHKLGEAQGVKVWSPPPGTEYSHELWAPELFYLSGSWYIYVAADDGNNYNHRMYVLESSTGNPLEQFELKGKITDSSDRWAIDGTVLKVDNGQLYFIWSGWEGNVNVRQNLYIAPMSDPWTISGERVLISTPELGWELNGDPLINEGPEVLQNGDDLFIIYSASGSWTDDYCLGQLRLIGGDPLDPDSWIKHSQSVFSRTADVFGPGHASFVKSPDGTEDWIIYHAAKYSGAAWDRDIRMQKFTWNEDGSPRFGQPWSTGLSPQVPSGE